jgi:hypothetical protein
VSNVGGNTWCHSDIIQGEFGDTGVKFEQEGERLANSTGGTQDGDLGVLYIKFG